MGLAAAAITAFYMARLMAMTFLGNNRTGDAERGHLHEAPWTMTGPLVVLGILSLTGGVINLPSFAGGHHALETWLEPVTEQAHALVAIHLPHGTTEALLSAAAVVVALVGLIWGTRATMAADIVPAAQAEEERGFWRVLYHKYYVDEFYDRIIIRPFMWLSEKFLWRGIDQRVIDGVGVNGTAKVARALGWVGSVLQTGQVGFYLVLFLIGAIWIMRVVVG